MGKSQCNSLSPIFQLSMSKLGSFWTRGTFPVVLYHPSSHNVRFISPNGFKNSCFNVAASLKNSALNQNVNTHCHY